MTEPKKTDPLITFGALVALAAAIGLALVPVMAVAPESRAGGFLGVGVASATGLLALAMKRRAVSKSVNAALGTIGILMLIRLVAVAVCLIAGTRAGLSPLAIVAGFFGEYFVLQAIEIRYALSVLRRLQPAVQAAVQERA